MFGLRLSVRQALMIRLSGTLMSKPNGRLSALAPSGSTRTIPPFCVLMPETISPAWRRVSSSRIASRAWNPVSPGAVFSLSSSCSTVPRMMTVLSCMPYIARLSISNTFVSSTNCFFMRDAPAAHHRRCYHPLRIHHRRTQSHQYRSRLRLNLHSPCFRKCLQYLRTMP